MTRDYKHEYAIRKDKGTKSAYKTIATIVPIEIAEEFKAKCALDNTTANSLLKEFIHSYINGDLTFDGESIKAQK